MTRPRSAEPQLQSTKAWMLGKGKVPAAHTKLTRISGDTGACAWKICHGPTMARWRPWVPDEDPSSTPKSVN